MIVKTRLLTETVDDEIIDDFDKDLRVYDIITNEDILKVFRKHNCLLKESQESKSIDAAKKLYMQRTGNDREKSREFISNLVHDIPFLGKQAAKFTLGVTRMFLDNQLPDADAINKINTTLKYVATEAHINEYDRNLNGMSADELIEKFAPVITADIENEKKDIESMDFSKYKSRYKIVRIDSFEQSCEYEKYTYPKSRWCLTYDKRNYDHYTSDGINQVYFCLRDDFKSVEAEPSDKSPLDDYGLSMISVIVDPDGILLYCTSRWNHKENGTDNVMNAKEISQIVGVNFYETFKPNNKWRDKVNDIQKKLNSGTDIEKCGFSYVYHYNGGKIKKVTLDGKVNIVNGDNKIILDKWVDEVEYYHQVEKFIIKLKKKYNVCDLNGKLMFDKWPDGITMNNPFDMFVVKVKDKFNMFRPDGKQVLSKWVDGIDRNNEGVARIALNGKWTVVDKNGKPVLNKWYDRVGFFNSHGLVKVRLNNKFNLINRNNEMMSEKWLDQIELCLDHDFYLIHNNDKHNFMSLDGKVMMDEWVDRIDDDFSDNGLITVTVDDRGSNVVNTSGKLLSPDRWFDMVFICKNGMAIVILKDKFNLMKSNGKLISKDWFDIDTDSLNKNGYMDFDFKDKTYRVTRYGEISTV